VGSFKSFGVVAHRGRGPMGDDVLEGAFVTGGNKGIRIDNEDGGQEQSSLKGGKIHKKKRKPAEKKGDGPGPKKGERLIRKEGGGGKKQGRAENGSSDWKIGNLHLGPQEIKKRP